MKNTKKGFTLTEMAIVISIIAIVMSTMMNIGKTTLEKKKISTTKSELKSIKDSLIAYAARHGRLPYPDTNSSGRGNSDADCTTDDCELPYLDLGVKAKDNFGMAYNYDVWDGLINTNRDNFCAILQYSYNGNSLPQVQNDDEDKVYSVAATILSKGEDKVLTGENAVIPKNRIYEMKNNRYDDTQTTSNNDLIEELTVLELLGQVCDLVPTYNLSDGLIAHYKFNGDTTDEQGTYNGTVSGSVDTSNNYADLSPDGEINTDIDGTTYANWTISIWLHRDDWESENGRKPFIDVETGTNGEFEFFINQKDIRYRNRNLDDNSLDNLEYYDYTFSDNSWHHYVISQERTSDDNVIVNIYVDGVNVNANININFPDLENEIVLGKGRNTEHWEKSIDEFRFYNKVLSDTEVGILFGQGR